MDVTIMIQILVVRRQSQMIVAGGGGGGMAETPETIGFSVHIIFRSYLVYAFNKATWLNWAFSFTKSPYLVKVLSVHTIPNSYLDGLSVSQSY